jgi:hypothetical protein
MNARLSAVEEELNDDAMLEHPVARIGKESLHLPPPPCAMYHSSTQYIHSGRP